jgi:hypothetical protein
MLSDRQSGFFVRKIPGQKIPEQKHLPDFVGASPARIQSLRFYSVPDALDIQTSQIPAQFA